jgi:hypothetical protein
MKVMIIVLLFALLVLQTMSLAPWLILDTSNGGLFLTIGGYTKRWIPQWETYLNLCKNLAWTSFTPGGSPIYSTSPPLDTLAILVQPIGLPQIYLLENGTRYLIDGTFDKYGFNASVIQRRDPFDLQRYPMVGRI